MDVDTFFEKWQGHINSRYADHIREPMLLDMRNDLKKLVNSPTVNELALVARDFITIDDEIHSAPDDEDWATIKNRAESYTNARRKLLLFIKQIESTQISPSPIRGKEG